MKGTNNNFTNLPKNLTLKHPKLAGYIRRLQTTDNPAEREAILTLLENSNCGLITNAAVRAAGGVGACDGTCQDAFDDACQDARRGMINAALKVDTTRGNEYVYHYISKSMSNEAAAPYRREANAKVKFRSLDKPVGESEEGEEITGADFVPDENQKSPLEVLIDKEEPQRVEMMWSAINSVLPPEKAEIFRLYFDCDLKTAQVARRLNRPDHQVRYEINQIRSFLRRKLSGFMGA
ncbi:MAG: sigma-70 family RNA polymerase sigma factor [Thermoguttaceae bacterium]|nr:sigma-70 family RNA polymerase sigma factor [Thermoguttaceae bacterium]